MSPDPVSDAVPVPAAKRAKRPARPAWRQPVGEEASQHDSRRELLFRTAARAFNEAGYHQTTLDEVARRLNVTKPSIYYYVKDKDDILFECNRLAFLTMADALDDAATSAETGLEKLRKFLRRYTELMTDDFGACLIRTGLRPLRPESRAKLRVFANQLDKALRRIVEQGIADGSLRPCNAKLVSFALFGSFNGISGWYDRDGEWAPARIAEGFLDLFENGLAAHPR